MVDLLFILIERIIIVKNLGFLGYSMYCACTTGRIWSIRSGKFLKTVKNKKTGYLSLNLSQDAVRQTWLVHRLIALAFHSNMDNKLCVNHINGVKTDNRACNLEWVTYQENTDHMKKLGLKTNYINTYRTLSDDKAHQVCRMIKDSHRNFEIADILGIEHQMVANIRMGTDYADISKLYDFTDIKPSRRKLEESVLVTICEMLQEGLPYSAIQGRVKVSLATISHIKNRKRGTYISNDYNFK